MKSFIVSIVLLFAHQIAFANDCKHDKSTFRCVKLLSVYDGDTLNVTIPDTHPLFGEKIGVRVRGIDTPEISTKNTCEKSAGRIAKNLAESILKNAKRIDLENVSRDKYFRILADVKADGVSLADLMMKNKLAYKYDGGTKVKQDWCSFEKNRIPANTGK